MQTIREAVSKNLEKYEPNEFLKILKEPISLDEKLTAIYSRALQPEFFENYKPVNFPFEPSELRDELEIYKTAKSGEKLAIWREISTNKKFVGYFKALEQTQAENDSNKNFLQEMLKHFEKLNMPLQAQKIRQRMNEFEE